jgi:hypothetical protein
MLVTSAPTFHGVTVSHSGTEMHVPRRDFVRFLTSAKDGLYDYLDLRVSTSWLRYYGARVDGPHAILYKVTDQDLVAGHNYIPTHYTVGTTVEATDWVDNQHCGGGLHLSPRPGLARAAYQELRAGPWRLLRCRVLIDDIRVIDGNGLEIPKCKVPCLFVEAEVTEVDEADR